MPFGSVLFHFGLGNRPAAELRFLVAKDIDFQKRYIASCRNAFGPFGVAEKQGVAFFGENDFIGV